jgi:hypothetical protein
MGVAASCPALLPKKGFEPAGVLPARDVFGGAKHVSPAPLRNPRPGAERRMGSVSRVCAVSKPAAAARESLRATVGGPESDATCDQDVYAVTDKQGNIATRVHKERHDQERRQSRSDPDKTCADVGIIRWTSGGHCARC